MTDQSQAQEVAPETTEEIQARFAACKADIKIISDFAGGVPLLEENLKKDLKGINDNKGLVEKAITDFNVQKTAADTAAGAMQTAQEELQGKIDTLNTTYEDLETVVGNIEAIKEEAATAKKSVDDDVAAIGTAKTAFETLNTATQEAAKTLKLEQDTLQKQLTAVRGDHDSVVNYKKDLLDDKTDDNGNHVPSTKTKITTLHTQTEDKFKEIEKYRLDVTRQFAELEESLTAKIEALLPGAAAAGLSSAYFEAKGRYGLVPYTSTTKNSFMRGIEAARYYTVMTLRHSVNHIFFVAPLLGIVALFVDMMLKGQTGTAPVSDMDTIAGIPVSVLMFRFVLSLPLGVLALFGYSSIQLNRRLYEEYNYKQRVMQTYHGFEKEIEETNNEALKERLLTIMLNVVEDKPALSMADHQKPILNVQEALNGVRDTVKSLAEALPSIPGKPGAEA